MASVLSAQTPVGTAFTYQGQLASAGAPVNGSYDFRFILADAPIGGSEVGPILDLNGVVVTDGRFTVSLDFLAGAFQGEARWLDIAVRPAGVGSFTPLTPRQPLTAAPYALTAVTALTANEVADAAIVNADISGVANISGAKLADNSVPAGKIVDGTGSGLDGDLLDGLNSSQFLRSDVSGTLTGTLTINSAGGADAVLSENGIDRTAATATTFTIENSNATPGTTIQLRVEGNAVSVAPTYSFTADTDTGVYSPSADVLGIAAGGLPIVRVGTSGLQSTTTAAGSVAVKGTGPSFDIGDGVFGTATTAGRGVVAANLSNGTALVAASASGDHLRAGTSSVLDADPVLRVTSGGALLAEGAVRVGAGVTTGTAAPAFNSFGSGTADESFINSDSDVYITDDLEIDGSAYVATALNVGTTTILDTNSLDVADGFTITVGGSPANLVIAGQDARIRIGDTAADRVGIGRAPAVNNLEVAGDASKTTAGNWLANSDRRLKTDIEGLTDALGVIRRLRPVRFRYSDEFRRKHPEVKDVVYHNYVAQEFQEVFPASVQDDGEGFLQMDAHPASIYAVGAIQELERLLTEKDAKIAALERRLTLVEDAVARWTAMAGSVDRASAATERVEGSR